MRPSHPPALWRSTPAPPPPISRRVCPEQARPRALDSVECWLSATPAPLLYYTASSRPCVDRRQEARRSRQHRRPLAARFIASEASPTESTAPQVSTHRTAPAPPLLVAPPPRERRRPRTAAPAAARLKNPAILVVLRAE
ncbi:hypothetical protein PAHAL_9G347900 [Panicum hallii]|uniref:Uncharacterized protein n=1 Tax=Panicum hallii TaxID=206008 RepID=A0A2T8I3J0_9POAL|nr:hypothetical protein PAHAL_9G347900 [Panicum hallii]PAN47722.1 hypothetical protein PAHAL_9G347900 [Panicum hallii]PAN47723.1 hypothetical protein PAHAL_9G347900 [Panicum hallii]PAN47724.1 hypothetical protein PAHAL_9G347900 [Panicum hallii]PAN47725.1 hypothetical protein PAHAL_9G347900 [Panicum hallii]